MPGNIDSGGTPGHRIPPQIQGQPSPHKPSADQGVDQSEETASTDKGKASTRSMRSRWRQLAGGEPRSPATKTTVPPVTSPISFAPPEDLNAILTGVKAWSEANPGQLTDEIGKIKDAIANLKTNPTQNNGDSLRAFIQLTMQNLFSTAISHSVPQLSDLLVNTLGFSESLVPSSTPPTGPAFLAGYVAFSFKNLQPTDMVQIGGSLGYLTASGQLVKDPVSIKGGDLPVDSNGNRYIYIPQNDTAGRIYFNNSSTFCEFSVNSAGDPNVNFTGVDGISSIPVSIQMTGKQFSSIPHGIVSDRASFVSTMQQLYARNDYYSPGTDTSVKDAWRKVFTDAGSSGTIPSGKQMNVAAITGAENPPKKGSLAEYLQNTFIQWFQSHDLYFNGDGSTGTQVGRIQPGGPNGWVFVSGSVKLPLPPLTDIESWISGSAAGWKPQDENSKDPAIARTGSIQWGAIKALTSLINTGIPPDQTNTSIHNPIGGDYFTNIDNVKNFYQADFYNVYRRAVHEAGCNAYASDFDDQMGAAGFLSDSARDQPFVTITLGSSTPKPPVPPVFTPQAATDALWDTTPGKGSNVPALWNAHNVAGSLIDAINQYNQDLADYMNLPDSQKPAAWPNLNDEYSAAMKSLQGFKDQQVAFNTLLYDQPAINDCLKKAFPGFGSVTNPQLTAIAEDMTARKIPSIAPLPKPPAPPGPPPSPPDLEKLFKLHPEIKALYDQEVIQLTKTFHNEGSKGPNVLPLISKHREDDFIPFLQRGGYSLADQKTWANALSAQEWIDAGGKIPSPLPPLT